MSLARMVFLSGLLAGWAAFAGWLVCEFLVVRAADRVGWAAVTVAAAAAVGAGIGAGVGCAAGLTEGTWRPAAAGAGWGLVGGVAGGLIGGGAGQLLYSAGLPRAVGWALMGLGIGATDGLLQGSSRKTLHGLLGGGVGGLVGGLLFDPIGAALAGGTGMASRATGFVILGVSVGALVGLAQVVFRDAWVSVVDGFRTGRQLILTRPVTVLGRSELAHLPFLGRFGQPLELEHVRIERRPDGRFVLVDNDTATGTVLNNRPVTGPVVLADGDVIRLGSNYVRFNQQGRERYRAPRPAAGGRPAEPPPWVEETPPAPPPARAPEVVPMAVLVPEPAPPPRPPRAAPPPARPPAPPPARPPAPPRAPAPAVAKPRAPAPPPKPPDPDACPYCRTGVKHDGAPGARYCVVHDQMY